MRRGQYDDTFPELVVRQELSERVQRRQPIHVVGIALEIDPTEPVQEQLRIL